MSKRTATSIERFFAKVDRNGPVPSHVPGLGPCHIWTGCIVYGGYGQISFLGKARRAHRVAYFLVHGRWPEPLALHKCDNRACVNPAHLFEGTYSDNAQDKAAKGRSAKRLTDPQVVEILRLRAAGVAARKLGEQFGVTPTYIRMLARGQWRPSARKSA